MADYKLSDMKPEDYIKNMNTSKLNAEIAALKRDGLVVTKDISDTYHTIGELYEHRMALTAALVHYIKFAKEISYDGEESTDLEVEVYKSWKHHDDTMFDGMFIVVIEDSHVGQISYHYNAEHWNKFDIPEKAKANKYDGHTPKDTIERLLAL